MSWPSTRAVSKTIAAVAIIVVIVVAGVGVYFFTTSRSPVSGPTTMSSGSSMMTSSAVPGVQSITYETLSSIQYLDPQVSYDIYGASVEQNVYEPLLWFNGTNGQQVIPWLAQSYSLS